MQKHESIIRFNTSAKLDLIKMQTGQNWENKAHKNETYDGPVAAPVRNPKYLDFALGWLQWSCVLSSIQTVFSSTKNVFFVFCGARLCFLFFFAPECCIIERMWALFQPPVDKSGDFAHRATEHVNGLVDNMLLASAFFFSFVQGMVHLYLGKMRHLTFVLRIYYDSKFHM